MSALGDLVDMGGTLRARDIPRLSRWLVAGASAAAVAAGAIAAAASTTGVPAGWHPVGAGHTST